MSGRLMPPLTIGVNGSDGFGTHFNNTLHGRSVYRSQDVPGHNVFNGYTTWANNGHHGVGDALDCYAPGGTPVYAMHSGRQTVWRNDTEKLEVIYIEGNGYLTVYAHINATHEGTGMKIAAGEVVGYVRDDLNYPHLHLEVWSGGKAIAAPTPQWLAEKLVKLCFPTPEFTCIVNGQQLPGEVVELRDGTTWAQARAICEAADGVVTWDPDTKTAEFTFPPKTE